MVTDSHRQSQPVTSKNWYSCVQNCTEYQSHKYIRMTVTNTNITISLTQPNKILLGCKVLKVPFWMA